MNQHTARLTDAMIDRFALMSCPAHDDDLRSLASHCAAQQIEVFWPGRWLEHAGQPAIGAFYSKLEARMAALDLHPRKTPQYSRIAVPALSTVSALSYHSRQARPGIWHIKVSHLPDWFSFDRTGYAGWSELARSAVLQAMAQEMPIVEAREFTRCLARRLMTDNTSKFPQAAKGSIPLPAAPGFLFVPLQTEDDAVMEHAPGGIPRLITTAVEAGAASGLAVVFKRHPKCTSERVATLLRTACQRPHVHQCAASIHSLISGSESVLVQNSGTGFEAMIQGKPVYTLGVSDYTHVCRQIHSADDLVMALRANPTLSHQERDDQMRFVAFLGTRYAIRLDDTESLDRHLLRVLLTHMRLVQERVPC